MKKIIIKMRGGIGNQLFMLAYVLATKEYNNVELYIDSTDYKRYKIRNFELDPYIKSRQDINILTNDFSEFKLLKLNLMYNIYRSISYINEKINNIIKMEKIESIFFFLGYDFSRHGNGKIKTLKRKNYYMYGYFQDNNYVESAKNEMIQIMHNKKIERELLQNEHIEYYSHYILNCKRCLAVSIRCGDDYVQSGWPICSREYYSNSIKLICQSHKIEESGVIFFSDDIEHAKKMLKDSFPKALFINNVSPTESLFLMTLCHDYIISNSSFSWWGQKLSKNEKDKLVIAPEYWYRNNEKTKDSKLFDPVFQIMDNNGKLLETN